MKTPEETMMKNGVFKLGARKFHFPKYDIFFKSGFFLFFEPVKLGFPVAVS